MNVSSPVALGHRADPESKPDVHISVGKEVAAEEHAREPQGRLIAHYRDDRPRYSLFDVGKEGYFYRFHDLVDIQISDDQRHLECRLVAGAEAEMLPVILAGNVMSALMLLHGQVVLHASAVERDGEAVAMVGNPGAGKSTLAAIACVAGAHLVTDDVLRVKPDTAGEPMCFRGAAALRIRPQSKSLAAEIKRLESSSADGRHLMESPPTTLDTLPLRAIAVPRLRDPQHPLRRTALSRKSALLTLLRFPRVQNWQDPATSAQHFQLHSSLVGRLPVYELEVPRDIAVDGDWPRRILDLLFAPPPRETAAS